MWLLHGSSHYQSWSLPKAGSYLLPCGLSSFALSRSLLSQGLSWRLCLCMVWTGGLMEEFGRESDTQAIAAFPPPYPFWPLGWARKSNIPHSHNFLQSLTVLCYVWVITPFPKWIIPIFNFPHLPQSFHLSLSLQIVSLFLSMGLRDTWLNILNSILGSWHNLNNGPCTALCI